MPTLSLVTGATGFLGSHVAEALLQKGHRVRCLARRTSDRSFLAGQAVEWVEGHLNDPESMARAVADVDYVFHCAGVIRARTLDEFRAANVRGVGALARAAADHARRLKRFVHISSLAAAGPSSSPRPIDELSPCVPVSDYGQSKLEGEWAAQELGDRIPLTLIRPPVIFGPRDLGVLALFKLVRTGFLPNLVGLQLLSIVYVKDLVEGILQAAESRKAEGQAYFVCNDDFIRYDEMFARIGRVMGVRNVRRLYVRPGVLKAAASLNVAVMNVLGRATFFSPDKVREMEQKYWICSNAKARKDFAFAQTSSLDGAFSETAAWYRQHRWI